MNKTARRILFVVIAVIALVGIGLLVHQSKSKSTLEKYKAGLRAKGELLSFAELTASFTTNVFDSLGVITNAAIKLRQASIQPGGSGVMEFVAPGKARVAWMQEMAILYGSGKTEIAWENFSAQLDRVSDVLEKIREAMQAPAPHMGVTFPPPFLPGTSIGNLSSWSFVQSLNAIPNCLRFETQAIR